MSDLRNLATARAAAAHERFITSHRAAATTGELPPDTSNFLVWQSRLLTRQRRGIWRATLELIEATGRTFALDNNPELAVDALGDAVVAAAHLAGIVSLDIEPVLNLASLYASGNELGADCLNGPALVASAILDLIAEQSDAPSGPADRGEVMHAIAVCLAKAHDDVALIHDLAINLKDFFLVVASERVGKDASVIPARVRLGKLTFSTPTQIPQETSEQRELRKGRAMKEFHDALDGEFGDRMRASDETDL